jgi:hypothetical protein
MKMMKNALTGDQVGIILAVRAGRANFDSPCQPERGMSVQTRIFAQTKSDALVLLGSMQFNEGKSSRAVPVAIKITFLPKRKGAVSGSQIELKIYEREVQNLLLNQNTPNVVALYAASVCSYGTARLPAALSKLKAKLLARKDADTASLDLQRVQVLVMERALGVNVEKYLQGRPPEADVRAVLFQVLYTLVCFQQVGLRHNDLHFGNILVEAHKFSAPTYVNYFVSEDAFYRINVAGAFVKIFDFERASLPTTLQNPSSGVPNTANYKYDLFSFLSRLMDVPAAPSALKRQLRECCMSSAFARRYAFSFSLCRLNAKNQCVPGDMRPSDAELNTPLQFLTKLFAGQLHSLKEESKRRSAKDRREFFRHSYFLPKLL